MLNIIREKTQGWIAFILLAIITVPFALWGISSYFGGSSRTSVAKVDGSRISIKTYQNALEQERNQYAQALGHPLTPAQFADPAFKQAVLDALIDRLVLIHSEEKAGYRVPDAQLAFVIRSMGAFQQDGQFNPQAYRAVLKQNGYTVPEFESSLRTDVLLDQLRGGIETTAIVTDRDVARLLALEEESRTFRYTTFDPARLGATATVSPAEVQAYYTAHQTEFSTPAQVRVAYVVLDPAAIAAHVVVPEKTLKTLYQNHLADFHVEGERKASHILVALPPSPTPAQVAQGRARAEALLAKIRAGASFSAIARKDSADAGSAADGGSLGYVRRGTMPAAFDQVLFSLKPGQVGGPVRTSFGWHLIKLDAIRPGATKSYAQARPMLLAMARARVVSEDTPRDGDRLRRLSFEHPHSLGPAAKALGLTIQSTGWFERGTPPAGVLADQAALDAIFVDAVLKGERNSAVVHVGEGEYLAVHVTGYHPAALKPLQQVSADIARALREQAGTERAAAVASALLVALVHGKAQGAIWHGPMTVNREGSGQALDPALLSAVFAVAKPAHRPAYGQVTLSDGSDAVFAVDAVVPGQPNSATPDERTAALAELHTAGGKGLYDAYTAYQRARAKVRIYQANQ